MRSGSVRRHPLVCGRTGRDDGPEVHRDAVACLEELQGSGALVVAGGLHPPTTAVTVDHTGDGLALVDEPYTQAPEYLGGLWVIEAPDRDAAVSWAAKASQALGSRIEVRAFQEIPAQGMVRQARRRQVSPESG